MGLAPQVASASLLSYVPELSGRFEIEAKDILSMDSSNIQAEEWQTIARAVYDQLDRFDGIVITPRYGYHGLHGLHAQLHASEPEKAGGAHRLPGAH